MLLDGLTLSKIIKKEIESKTSELLHIYNKKPHLCAILVGNDGASKTYVESKSKDCRDVGFDSTVLKYEDTITQDFLIKKINELNNDDSINGIIVQLPLPKHIDEKIITESILTQKDVDGFCAENAGKLSKGERCFVPATPLGITKILSHYNIETSGKHCVIIGRSNIVGRPISVLMSSNNATGNCTVTICHSKTQDLKKHTLQADILICAIGKPELIDASYIKKDAIVIDVGITRVDDTSKKQGYTLKGDLNISSIKEKTTFYTPVPGGVGPMTRVGLLLNTLEAFELQNI